MSNKKIIVRTGSLEEAAKEFIDIWHKVEAGDAPQKKLALKINVYYLKHSHQNVLKY